MTQFQSDGGEVVGSHVNREGPLACDRGRRSADDSGGACLGSRRVRRRGRRPDREKTFTFKLGKKFKKQLKKNGVKMKPKALKLTKGDIDPTNGTGDLKFGKVTFKKGKKKVVQEPQGIDARQDQSPTRARMFKLTAPEVDPQRFRCRPHRYKVKFLKSAAKKINKGLGCTR